MKSLRRLLLSPLALLYALIYLLRWTFYRLGFFKTVKVSLPVISVGNLTVGGSGKTPFIAYMLKYWRAESAPPGVVSRSYKAASKKTSLLPAPEEGELNPKIHGDEASLLKSLFPKTPVVSGPSKWKAAQRMLQEKVGTILVDDGYQHWRLHRDLDVVLLDATEDPESWAILPLGRAREPFAALSRAQVVVLTKTNLASREQVERLYRKIQQSVSQEAAAVLCESVHTLTGLRRMPSGERLPLSELAGKKLALLSGLAKPEAFESLLVEAGAGPVLVHRKLGDHSSLTQAEVKEFERQCQQLGCQALVMTEKDAIKWKLEGGFSLEVFACALELEITKNEERFWNEVDQLFV